MGADSSSMQEGRGDSSPQRSSGRHHWSVTCCSRHRGPEGEESALFLTHGLGRMVPLKSSCSTPWYHKSWLKITGLYVTCHSSCVSLERQTIKQSASKFGALGKGVFKLRLEQWSMRFCYLERVGNVPKKYEKGQRQGSVGKRNL